MPGWLASAVFAPFAPWPADLPDLPPEPEPLSGPEPCPLPDAPPLPEPVEGSEPDPPHFFQCDFSLSHLDCDSCCGCWLLSGLGLLSEPLCSFFAPAGSAWATALEVSPFWSCADSDFS